MVRISDISVLKLLMGNSRQSFISMAKSLGVTETAVRKRVRKLEENKTIRGYTIEVDPRSMGFGIKAMIGVDTLPEKYIKVLEELRAMENVVNLYSSSGDHMIVFESWLKNSQGLSDFVKSIESLEGVIKVCPAVIMDRIK